MYHPQMWEGLSVHFICGHGGCTRSPALGLGGDREVAEETVSARGMMGEDADVNGKREGLALQSSRDLKGVGARTACTECGVRDGRI